MAITPELISELKSKNFEVIIMKHAYRINGCVDIWFNGKKIYDKKKNEYTDVKNQTEGVYLAIKLAQSYGKVDAFKKTEKGRMTYKEFRNRKTSLVPIAEYSHWNNDNKVSEDHLYFILSGINVKIGRSNNPEERLKTLYTGIAEIPSLICVVKNKAHMEFILHKCFSEERIRKDAEWFIYSERIKKFITYISK